MPDRRQNHREARSRRIFPGARGTCIAVVLLAALAPAASASQLIDRNATDVRLEVDRAGTARVTYHRAGVVRHVYASGAVNALPPTRARPQVAFNLKYTSSAGPFANACTPATPPLQWLVTACRAADGSLWALQSWQRELPNYGAKPSGSEGAHELRLSHWTGALPRLSVRFGWTYRRFQQLYGAYTYLGHPIFGFRSTSTGAPVDTFGRNVYVDTFGSRYGPGWRRENSFLTHAASGGFCYGFYPHGRHPQGTGARYRATVIGPGVAPDAFWEGTAPGSYSRDADLGADRDMRTLLGADPLCRAR